MDELWGQIKPIAAAQLQMVDDQEIIEVAGLQIIGHHTPGHAKHHIAWQIKEHIFTGDVAGIAIEGGPVIPPCPPPDIHIEHWKESLARLRSIKEAEVFYLAHFGSVANLSSHLDELEQSLDNYAQFMLPFYENGKTIAETIPVFESFALQLLRDQEVNEEIIAAYKTANPADMSVAGLMRYWKKHGSS